VPTLLHLDSSSDVHESRSRAITRAFADAWASAGDDFTIVHRDLHADPLPHLASSWLHWPASMRPDDVVLPAEAEALQAALIEELLSADVLLVAAPLYTIRCPRASRPGSTTSTSRVSPRPSGPTRSRSPGAPP